MIWERDARVGLLGEEARVARPLHAQQPRGRRQGPASGLDFSPHPAGGGP